MAEYPTTCKAALVVEPGNPLEIREVPVPQELEPGAILVKTTMATICASDVHVRAGKIPPLLPKDGPAIAGHEMVGEIVAFGEGLRQDSVGQPLKEGDVISWSHSFCGSCTPCTVTHEPELCTGIKLYMTGAAANYPHLTGGFSEYCYVYPGSGRVKVPDNVSLALASANACALRTVVHAFDRLGRIEGHQTVLIQGTGPLGLFAIAMAHSAGAREVIAVGGPAHRLEVARRWGASHTFDVTEMDAAARQEKVMGLTGGLGAEVVMEFSGAPSAVPEGMALIRRGGRYVVVGQVSPHEVTMRPMEIMYKQISLIGSVSASIEHYYKGLQFLCSHADRYPFDELISNYYLFEQINEALDKMERLEEIKPAITFS